MTSRDWREDRFRTAARAYFLYGLVYLIGGAYLAFQGVGVRAGGSVVGQAVAWTVLGLALWLSITFLLRRRRPWFERWILSRRDFARILSVFLAYRAYKVGAIAARSETASVPAPWGGAVSFRVGAAVFLLVTLAALAFVARAAWTPEGSR